MACSLSGFLVHGIFQVRILEWVTISFSRRSSGPRDWTHVSSIVGRRFTVWATREVSLVQSLNWVCCVIISSGIKEKNVLRLRNVEKKSLFFPPPWEFQTPISSFRAPDPSLLRGPGLLIRLLRNWLCHCHALLQGIFPTKGLNPGLLHCKQILYHLSNQGSPRSWLICTVNN